MFCFFLCFWEKNIFFRSNVIGNFLKLKIYTKDSGCRHFGILYKILIRKVYIFMKEFIPGSPSV